jgi:hypothetical protein
MVASIEPPRYGLVVDHLLETEGGVPKKQLAAAQFRSTIRAAINVLAGQGNSARRN